MVFAATLIACSNVGKDEFILNGSIKGVPDGKVVVLERYDDSLGAVTVDTAKVKAGKFTFKGKILEPEMHSLRIENVQNNSYVIIENGEIDLEIVMRIKCEKLFQLFRPYDKPSWNYIFKK